MDDPQNSKTKENPKESVRKNGTELLQLPTLNNSDTYSFVENVSHAICHRPNIILNIAGIFVCLPSIKQE